jgi:hypothetical protein
MLLIAHDTVTCTMPGANVPSDRVALRSLPAGSPPQPAMPLLRAFLIAGVCPTFAAAPLFTHHLPLITRHCTSNRYSQLIRNRPNPLTTNEKTFSNRYDSSNSHSRAAVDSSLVSHPSPLPHPISIRFKFALGGTGMPAEGGRSRLCALFLRQISASAQRPQTIPRRRLGLSAVARLRPCLPGWWCRL